MRRAQPQTVTFPAFDSTTGARKPGITFLAGDIQISKEGGAFVNTTSLPAEIGSSGVYALSLTAAELDCAWFHVIGNKAATRPIDFGGDMTDQPTAAVAGTGQTTTSFVTNLTSAVNEAHKGKIVRFQTGLLAGQVRKVTAYNGGTKALSFNDAFSAAPAAGDVFALIDD